MKKILLIILLFAGLITKAQFPNTVTGGNSSTLNKQLGAYGANLGYVWTAAYSDTTAANLSFIKNVPGIVIRIGNDLWMRSANVLVWIKISGGGTNIYNSDGVIADALRTVDVNNNTLFFDDAGGFEVLTRTTGGHFGGASISPTTSSLYVDTSFVRAEGNYVKMGFTNGNNIYIDGIGRLRANRYGLGNFTGVLTYRLGVNSDGDIIEDTTTIGSGGGYFNPDQTSTGNTLHNGNNHDFVVDSSSNITYHLKKDHDSQFDIFASQGFFAGIGEIGSSYYGYYDLWPTFNEIYLGVDDGETMINQTPHSGGAETLIWSKVSGAGSFVGIEDDRIYLDARNGNLQLGLLTNLSTQNRLLGQFGTSTQVGYTTIGSNLLMSSGALLADTTTGGTKLATQGDITRAIAGFGTGSNLSWDAANHQVDIDGGGTSATIPYATTATDGLISSASQTIDGAKTFNNGIVAPSISDASALFNLHITAGQGDLSLSNGSATDHIRPQASSAGSSNRLPNTGNVADTLATLYDVRAGGGGSTPDLQAVTNVDNETTNDILINRSTATLSLYDGSANAAVTVGLSSIFHSPNDGYIGFTNDNNKHTFLSHLSTQSSLKLYLPDAVSGDTLATQQWVRDNAGGGGGGYTNLTQFVAQNNWKIFHSDGSGDVQELSLGAAGSPFYSVGTSSTPAFFSAVTYATSGTNVLITALNTTDKILNIKGVSSYAEDYFSISTSSGTGDLLKVNSTGELLLGGNSDAGDYDLQLNKGIVVNNVGNNDIAFYAFQGTTSTGGSTVGAIKTGGGLTLLEAAAPGTPSANQSVVYVKSDGLFYGKDDAGVETMLSNVAGGGLTIGTTTITSGTDTRILFNNAGVVGEYPIGSGIATFLATPSSANLITAITDETGSGALVFGTSPTLTTPKFANGGFIADANGNELIIFTTTASATNEFTIANGNGTSPKLSATGGSTNIGIDFQSKGTGSYQFLGTADVPATINLYEDTDNGTNFIGLAAPTIMGSNFTATLPAATGTLVMNDNSAALTTKTIALGSNTVSGSLAEFNTALTGDNFATLGAAQTFTGTQTMSSEVITNTAVTASGNAATVAVTASLTTVTNNSAATLTITLTTASAVDGQVTTIRILDFSAATQTITWVNTENSSITAPTTSNGSTTLFLTVKFIYNSATSKWRCIGYA